VVLDKKDRDEYVQKRDMVATKMTSAQIVEADAGVSPQKVVAIMGGKPIMTPGYVTANFAIMAGYFFVGALVLIFVGMLVLTAVHPWSAPLP